MHGETVKFTCSKCFGSHRLICRHNIDCVYTDEHRKTTIVVLANHRTAPWWWFLRESKHVGASVIILSCFNISMIFIIVCISWNNKKCFCYWFHIQGRSEKWKLWSSMILVNPTRLHGAATPKTTIWSFLRLAVSGIIQWKSNFEKSVVSGLD
jgi:hypothetical protein